MIYFVHIPKTAGITLKTYLENHLPRGSSLVIDEQEARALPAERLQGYELLSGHYSSEVLEALGRRPDVTLMLVREPLARMQSWAAHCRRVSDMRYRTIFEGRTDLEAMRSGGGYTCHQAYWIARALRDGADSTRVPTLPELPALLDRVDIVGLTEEIDRFMQLLAFRMGWPPPPLGWHINRRPDGPARPRTDEEEAMSDLLGVDYQLYAQVEARFWSDYAAMLHTIDPAHASVGGADPRQVDLAAVQEALRAHHHASAAAVPEASIVEVTGDPPLEGEGWWWRECPGGLSYRWTGPEPRATLRMPALVPGREYDLTVDLMGAADWDTWDAAGLQVNGVAAPAVREWAGPVTPGGVTLRLHARVPPEVVARQQGATEVALTVPETRQALTHVTIRESYDTYNKDLRAVGLAVHRIRVAPRA